MDQIFDYVPLFDASFVFPTLAPQTGPIIIPSPLPNTSSSSSSYAPIKRGRGRPRKSESEKKTKPSKSKQQRTTPPLPIDGIPVKRGRGRPRKYVPIFPIATTTTPLPLLPLLPAAAATTGEPSLFRTVATYPAEVMDADQTNYLSIEICEPSQQARIIGNAENKVNNVRQGFFKFGCPVVIKSFRARAYEYMLPAIASNLFLLNVLCSLNVMKTKHGKVSVFPVTVFTSEDQRQDGRGGEPCLAIHVAHMKVLIWRVFSASRCVVNNGTLMSGMESVCHAFNCADDKELTILSGVEEYNKPHLQAKGAFMLLPAGWFDVMKVFFIKGENDFYLRDIGEIFSGVYDQIETLRGKFDDTFRVLWLGEEREANVAMMTRIHKPYTHHTFSMTRCRALNQKVRVNSNGMRLDLPPPNHPSPLKYNELSFGYGVICWKEQLQILNSAYTFVTGQLVTKPTHQFGLFFLDENTPVGSREDCLKIGILEDVEKSSVDRVVRMKRYALSQRYGQDFIRNYFGANRVYYSKQEDDTEEKFD